MSSENDADVRSERLRNWRALMVSITEDTEKLIAALKEKRPEVWDGYFRAVAEGADLPDEVGLGIIRMAHELFPQKSSNDVINLKFRMNELVADQLGGRRNDVRTR